MGPRLSALLLVLALAACCAQCDDAGDEAGGCPYTGAAPTNSCYYCCFAAPGAVGSLSGCYSGETVTAESCRERLLHEKNCPDPIEIELLEGCQCGVDCEAPDWFADGAEPAG